MENYSQDSYDKELESIRKELKVEKKGELMNLIDKGLEGLNRGIPNGMTTLNRFINGTHEARYDLIAADSGAGKTTLMDYMYFYNLVTQADTLGIELKLDYYSLEISRAMKIAKMASLIYYLDYKETIPSDIIIGESIDTTRRITPIQYERMKLVDKKVENLFSKINFIEVPTTPYDMWNRMVQRASEDGEVVRNRDKKGRVSEIVGYIPKRKVFRMTLLDHIALLETEKGLSTKQTIDTASTYFVRARNLFRDSIAVVQQFNSELQGAARERKGNMAYIPQRRDLGDSSYTFRDRRY